MSVQSRLKIKTCEPIACDLSACISEGLFGTTAISSWINPLTSGKSWLAGVIVKNAVAGAYIIRRGSGCPEDLRLLIDIYHNHLKRFAHFYVESPVLLARLNRETLDPKSSFCDFASCGTRPLHTMHTNVSGDRVRFLVNFQTTGLLSSTLLQPHWWFVTGLGPVTDKLEWAFARATAQISHKRIAARHRTKTGH